MITETLNLGDYISADFLVELMGAWGACIGVGFGIATIAIIFTYGIFKAFSLLNMKSS